MCMWDCISYIYICHTFSDKNKFKSSYTVPFDIWIYLRHVLSELDIACDYDSACAYLYYYHKLHIYRMGNYEAYNHQS
jgi:hypothetical protein